MASDIDKLLSDIRALPEEEKLRLLDVLLTDPDAPYSEIDQIWANEASKRWDAYKAGSLETVSYDDVIRRMKQPI